MNISESLNPIDYLIIGHITIDITPQGFSMGGTATYSALTAHAMGLRVGIVTAWGEEISPQLPSDIFIYNIGSEHSSTFELTYTHNNRSLKLKHIAPKLDFYHIPETWRKAPIVHLAPIVHEINPNLVRRFSDSAILCTPQGWLREWDEEGNLYSTEWPEARHILQHASVVVISEEDINYDSLRIDEFAQASQILIVTRSESDTKLYMDGEEFSETPPQVTQVDPTGAGDIFAAAFMIRYIDSGSELTALQFANMVAARSVADSGMDSAPTKFDLYNLPILGE